MDVLLALQQPHLIAGANRVGHLRGAVQDGVELLGFALDSAPVAGHEQLAELLVTRALSGALLADDLLDQAALVVEVGVPLDLSPLVVRVTSRRRSGTGDQSREATELAAALPGSAAATSSCRRDRSFGRARVAARRTGRPGSVRGLQRSARPALGSRGSRADSPAALTAPPRDVHRRGALVMHRTASHGTVAAHGADSQSAVLEDVQDAVEGGSGPAGASRASAVGRLRHACHLPSARRTRRSVWAI